MKVRCDATHGRRDLGKVQAALRVLKKRMDREGVTGEIRAHEHFTPASQVRRTKARRKLDRARNGKPVRRERQGLKQIKNQWGW